jgi:hypothetical protein
MSRKFLVTIILILFILPFVSWYYLQRGLDWRKEAQSIMNGTEPFPTGDWTDINGRAFTPEQLEGHVSLIARIDCGQSTEISTTLDQFYDQFKETKKANFIILNLCEPDTSDFGKPMRMEWFPFSCSDSSTICTTLKSRWPEGMKYALVDKRKIIRSYYPGNTKEEKRLLLEHMALLLPRDRSEKVELKRGNKQ